MESRRVTIVTPCFNATEDLRTLYADLEGLDLSLDGGSRIEANLIVIDNASTDPISQIPPPRGWDVEVVRLKTNTGGSGGYNAGMASALKRGQESGEPPEFLWLLDSDARPNASTLRALIEAIDTDPSFVIMGSAIARPTDGVVFEIGGKLDRIGQFGPCYGEKEPAPAEVVEVGYAAACSALVRAELVERVGLFPEVFLNSDDIEWSFRLAQEAGGKVGATTRSVVRHPQMKAGLTRPRYVIARNAFGPIDALGLGARVRFLRALRELPRALAQIMIGRADLAELHLRGLEDAAANKLTGAGAMFELPVEPFKPMAQAREALEPYATALRSKRVWVHPNLKLSEENASALEAAMEDAGAEHEPIVRGAYPLAWEPFGSGVLGGLWRLVRGPRYAAAIIPVRGRPDGWCRGRVQIQVTPDSLIVTRCDRLSMIAGALRCSVRGVRVAIRLALRKPAKSAAERLPNAQDYPIDREPAA